MGKYSSFILGDDQDSQQPSSDNTPMGSWSSFVLGGTGSEGAVASTDSMDTRLKFKDDLVRKLDYIREQAPNKDEFDIGGGVKASEALTFVNSSSFNNDDMERMSPLIQSIEKSHKAVADKRNILEVGADAFSRGYVSTGAQLAQAGISLKPSELTEVDKGRLQDLQKVSSDYETRNAPRAVGGLKDVAAGDGIGEKASRFLRFGVESIGENLPRMAGAIAGGIAGGIVAGPAAAGLGAGIGAGIAGFGQNLGEAVSDQVDEGQDLNRGLAFGQAAGYSAIDSVLSVEKMAGGIISQVFKKSATSAGRKAFTGTMKAVAKTALKAGGEEALNEPMQSQIVGRMRRFLQTGSAYRPGEDLTGAMWEAADEAAGGFLSGMGLGGGSSAIQYARDTAEARTSRKNAFLNNVVTGTGNSMADLDQFDSIAVMQAINAEVEATHLDTLGVQADPQKREKMKSDLLNVQREAVAGMSDKAKLVWNAAHDVLATDFSMGQVDKSKKSTFNLKNVVSTLEDVGDGNQMGFDKDSGIGMAKGADGTVAVYNQNGLKMPADVNPIFDNLQGAAAFAEDLARFNEQRMEKLAPKFQLLTQIAQAASPGANVRIVDTPAQLPANVKKDYVALLDSGAPGQAMYDKNSDTVYIVHGNIQTVGDAIVNIHHEAMHSEIQDMENSGEKLPVVAGSKVEEQLVTAFENRTQDPGAWAKAKRTIAIAAQNVMQKAGLNTSFADADIAEAFIDRVRGRMKGDGQTVGRVEAPKDMAKAKGAPDEVVAGQFKTVQASKPEYSARQAVISEQDSMVTRKKPSMSADEEIAPYTGVELQAQEAAAGAPGAQAQPTSAMTQPTATAQAQSTPAQAATPISPAVTTTTDNATLNSVPTASETDGEGIVSKKKKTTQKSMEQAATEKHGFKLAKRTAVDLYLDANGKSYGKPRPARIKQVIDEDTVSIIYHPDGGEKGQAVIETVPISRLTERRSTQSSGNYHTQLNLLNDKDRKIAKDMLAELKVLVRQTQELSMPEYENRISKELSGMMRGTKQGEYYRAQLERVADILGVENFDVRDYMQHVDLLEPFKKWLKENPTGVDGKRVVSEMKDAKPEQMDSDELQHTDLVHLDGEWFKVDRVDDTAFLQDGVTIPVDDGNIIQVSGVLSKDDAGYKEAMQEYLKQERENRDAKRKEKAQGASFNPSEFDAEMAKEEALAALEPVKRNDGELFSSDQMPFNLDGGEAVDGAKAEAEAKAEKKRAEEEKRKLDSAPQLDLGGEQTDTQKPTVSMPDVTKMSYNELVKATYSGQDARRKLGDLPPRLRSDIEAAQKDGVERNEPAIIKWLADKRGTLTYKGSGTATDILKNLPLQDANVLELEAGKELNRREQQNKAPEQKPSTAPKPPRTEVKSPIDNVSDAKKARLAAIQAELKSMLGRTNAGVDPKFLALAVEMASIYVEGGVKTFAQFAQAVKQDMAEVWDKIKNELSTVWYRTAQEDQTLEEVTGKQAKDIIASIDAEAQKEYPNNQEEQDNVPSTPDSMEQDSPLTVPQDQMGESDVQPESRRGASSPGLGKPIAEIQGELAQDDLGLFDSPPAPDRKQGDTGVRPSNAGRGGSIPGSPEQAGGGNTDDQGFNDVGEGDGTATETSSEGDESDSESVARAHQSIAGRIEKQKKADTIPVKIGNRQNIAETLPLLFEGQQDDVAFTEERFSKEDGYGVMFTNGTGTGKTYTGMGVIKRMLRSGKKNILIIAPNQGVIDAWQAAGRDLGITINRIPDTSTAGKGVCITTYKGLSDNDKLADTQWDMIVPDECHNLMSNQDGKHTSYSWNLRAISYHPEGVSTRMNMKYSDLRNRIKSARRNGQHLLEDSLLAQWREKDEEMKAEFSAKQGKDRTRVLFLSATPFAYQSNIEYAEGYLFEYGTKKEKESVNGYNEGSAREKFFMQHFGMTMRTNKLTRAGAGVDNDIMQRQFNEWLRKQGVLSRRMLDVEADYQRKFATVEDMIGKKIDEGTDYLMEAEGGRYRSIAEYVGKKFDYLSRMFLLEAIKAKHAVPLIKEMMDNGRKVVLFHDFNVGGGFNPFDLSRMDKNTEVRVGRDSMGKAIYAKTGDLIDEVMAKRPDIFEMDFSSLREPIVAMKLAFPGALFINGKTSKGNRKEALRKFNDDASGPQLLVIQSDAGREGISAHDISGKYRRNILNLGLPIKPTSSIQQEGRIYRTGQHPESHATFVYMNTGTNFERFTFAQKVFERSATAENLAMGDDARSLRKSFIEAFESAEPYAMDENEGRGGKDADKKNSKIISEFERAKTFYWGTQKRTSKNKSREGSDYFATPEPLGQKMVEWLDLKADDRVLEPSAGHGAISRFFPETTKNTIVEPSTELLSRASLTTQARIIQGQFENLDIGNKYDGIAMNPPFGTAGRTAVDHIAKAFEHLHDGGRIVAIMPEGSAIDKFDKWYGDTPNAQLVKIISLPSVVFGRAGTSVKTRVVIIDRLAPRQERNSDYSEFSVEADDINAFFDKIENMSTRNRTEAKSPVKETKQREIARGLTSDRGFVIPSQPKQGIKWTPEGQIKTVADTVEELRVPDVYRLLSETPLDNLFEMVKFLRKNHEGNQRMMDAIKSAFESVTSVKNDEDVAEPVGSLPIEKIYHTKRQQDIFIVKQSIRTSTKDYNLMHDVAKTKGGWYSRAWGKAPAGFAFETVEKAEEFAKQYPKVFKRESVKAGVDGYNSTSTASDQTDATRFRRAVASHPIEAHPGSLEDKNFIPASVIRKAEYPDIYKRESSRKTPVPDYEAVIGGWYQQDFGDETEIEQMLLLNPAMLTPNENMVWNNSEGRGWDSEKYSEWLESGLLPPPIKVIETEKGEMLVTDGHRRFAAALKLGQPVLALVSPVSPTPELSKESYSGRMIGRTLTKEMARRQFNGEIPEWNNTPWAERIKPFVMDIDTRFRRGVSPRESIEKRYVRALPSTDPQARALQAEVEVAYAYDLTPTTVKQAMTDARIEYERDEASKLTAQMNLLSGAVETGDINTDAKRMAIDKIAVDDLTMAAVNDPTDNKIATAMLGSWKYMERGTDVARAMQLRTDPVNTPEGRRAWIMRTILAPTKTEAEIIKKAQNTKEAVTKLMEKAKYARKVLEALKKKDMDVSKLTADQLMDDVFVAKLLQEIAVQRSGWGEMVHEWWRNAILSAPTTQIVNTVGNAGHAALEAFVQRPVEALMNTIVGNKDAATFNSNRAMYKAIAPSIQDANKAFLKSWATERTVTGPGASKIEEADVAIKGTAGKIIRVPQRLMSATDEWFKTIFMAMLTADYATREFDKLVKDGKKTEADRDTYVLAQTSPNSASYVKAWGETLRWSFQQKPGHMAASIMHWRNDPQFGFLLKFIFPFVKTPANIISSGIRKTPLGALPYMYNMWKGNYKGGEAMRLGAEQAVGMVLMASLYALMKGDDDDELNRPRITGSRRAWAKTSKGAKESEMQNTPPMSIRIGDKWVSYARLEPIATMVSTMVDALTVWDQAKDGKYSDIPETLFSSVRGNFSDKTFIQGIGNLVGIIEGDDGAWQRALTSTLAGFNPNIIRSTARALDPYIRDMRNRDKGKEYIKTAAERFGQTAMPAASLAPIPKMDKTGKPIEREGGALYNATVPFKVQDATKTTKVDAMVKRWNDAQDRGNRWYPATPDPVKVKIGRDEISMTDEEYVEYQRIAGEHAAMVLGRQSFNFNNPTERDIERVKDIYENARKVARERIRPMVVRRWRSEQGR